MQDDEERRIVERLAESDPDPAVRKSAVKRLDGFDLLRRCLETETDSGVREAASVRYRQLLAGGRGDDDVQERITELGRCGNARIIAHVTRGGREETLRLAALELCVDPVVLADAAINDPVARVRQAAVKALDDGDALKRVAERTRHGDHKVSRLARERLEAQQAAAQEAEARGRERDNLLRALDAMLAGAQPARAAEVARLENRWRAVEGDAPSETARRFADLAARARRRAEEQAASEEFARQSRERESNTADPAQILAELQAADEPETVQLDRLRDALEDAGEAASSLAATREYLAAARRYLERRDTLAELAEQAGGRAPSQDGGESLDTRLRELLEAVDWPERFRAPGTLRRARRAQVGVRAAEERDQSVSETRLGELHALLREVDEALGRGNLRSAQRALKRARSVVDSIPGRASGDAERKLRQATARVAELRDWRRFATVPKQQQLCERMEALIGADMPPQELATAVKALQDEWKATGGSDSPESRRLWERFHAAGERAFEPCREHFEALAEERNRNLAERQRITEQLQEFMERTDWESLDAAKLHSIRSKAREEWNGFAPVDRKAAKPVTRRFESLMERLTGGVRDKQEENRRRKRELLNQALGLDESVDIGQRIEAAKRLQREWQQLGPAQPAQERKLYREFKRACDAVFAERDARRDAEREEHNKHQAAAQALCERLETLLAEPHDDADTLKASITAAEAEFAGVGTLPQRTADGVRRRFDQAVRGLRTRIAEVKRAQARADLDELRRRAALCGRLEAAVQRGETPAVEALQAEWDAGAPMNGRAAQVLAARWRQAVAAAEAGGFEEGAADWAEEACRRLCVRAEILGGLSSPEEDAELRMSLQVERLSDGLAGGGREAAEDTAWGLELEWLSTGPATDRVSQDFEPRFRDALQAAMPR